MKTFKILPVYCTLFLALAACSDGGKESPSIDTSVPNVVANDNFNGTWKLTTTFINTTCPSDDHYVEGDVLSVEELDIATNPDGSCLITNDDLEILAGNCKIGGNVMVVELNDTLNLSETCTFQVSQSSRLEMEENGTSLIGPSRGEVTLIQGCQEEGRELPQNCVINAHMEAEKIF